MTYVDPVALSATSFSKTYAPPGSIEHIYELHKALVCPVLFWISTESTFSFCPDFTSPLRLYDEDFHPYETSDCPACGKVPKTMATMA